MSFREAYAQLQVWMCMYDRDKISKVVPHWLRGVIILRWCFACLFEVSKTLYITVMTKHVDCWFR